MGSKNSSQLVATSIAVAVTLTAGVVTAVARSSGSNDAASARRSVTASEVSQRPWPARVTATGPWSAAVTGSGDRFDFSTDGVVVGGLKNASLDFGADDPRKPRPADDGTPAWALALPDGSRWYPLAPFRLEAEGDLPFKAVEGTPANSDFQPFRSAYATGSNLRVRAPSFEGALAAASGPVTAVGRFVTAEGKEVTRLSLPAGSRASIDCLPSDVVKCSPSDPIEPVFFDVDVANGTLVHAAGDGEAVVAGSARAAALGHTWEGLVGAINASALTASAVFDNGVWMFGAEGNGARQVWVDVWPVVDTLLTATSGPARAGFFEDRNLTIELANVGHATSQIFEVEGLGEDARWVLFDLFATHGHDARLGVRRGGRVINLDAGGDNDSTLPPGGTHIRSSSARPGSEATIVLRGNFPEVHLQARGKL